MEQALRLPMLDETIKPSAIVRFLDHADRRIRRYIRAKQKLIKLLEEQKQAIIHRAITRGLDPNVRPALLGDRDAYRERLERWLKFAAIVKVSDEDLEWIWPGADPADLASHWVTKGRKLVVGWIGSPTTFQYLESLKDVLAEVARRHPFTLKVSGAGRSVNFPGVDVHVVPWSMADEVSLFNTCDIGVYPLTDEPWGVRRFFTRDPNGVVVNVLSHR